jgi:sarcosine oxidase subunit beta
VSRIVVAGAGAVGASIAYHLAQRGATNVVLAERATVASGSTGKAMGGVRQQFSTAAEVRLARESIAFLHELGAPLFEAVGYLFVATTPEGRDELAERGAVQRALGVPLEELDSPEIEALVPGLAVDDVLAGVVCREDGLADPPAVTRELVRRAVEEGVELREWTLAESLDADVLVIACGAASPELARTIGLDVPIRPLVRQLLVTSPVAGVPETLPMVIENETGFHFRRRGDRLVLAMGDDPPRWSDDETVDRSVFADRLERLARRYPRAAGVTIEDSWAGLYDMTPDAHPIIDRPRGDVVLACGFSGHGFMQSPAVGRAVAELLLDGTSSIDLEPYRLDRFASAGGIAEAVVL